MSTEDGISARSWGGIKRRNINAVFRTSVDYPVPLFKFLCCASEYPGTAQQHLVDYSVLVFKLRCASGYSCLS